MRHGILVFLWVEIIIVHAASLPTFQCVLLHSNNLVLGLALADFDVNRTALGAHLDGGSRQHSIQGAILVERIPDNSAYTKRKHGSSYLSCTLAARNCRGESKYVFSHNDGVISDHSRSA